MSLYFFYMGSDGEKWDFFHRLFYFALLKVLFFMFGTDGLSVYFQHAGLQRSPIFLRRASENDRIITAAEEGGR